MLQLPISRKQGAGGGGGGGGEVDGHEKISSEKQRVT